MAFEIVAMGASLGGTRVVRVLLAALPREFPAAVAVVIHRGREPGGELSVLLQESSALPVRDPEDKEPIIAGRVYLAPPDYHLLIDQGQFALSTEAPVSHARPSVDLLLESAADAYAGRAIGVILTGGGRDGAQGLAAIKRRGGLAVVQDPRTAEAPAMPEAAIAATPVDRVLPVEAIGPFLVDVCRAR